MGEHIMILGHSKVCSLKYVAPPLPALISLLDKKQFYFSMDCSLLGDPPFPLDEHTSWVTNM